MGFFTKLKSGIGTEEEAKEEKPSSTETAKDKGRKDLGSEKENNFNELVEAEGELAVDVYQTDSEIVVQSTIAGVKPDDLDISVENDVLTIRGKRESETKEEGKNYFYQECYWGAFLI